MILKSPPRAMAAKDKNTAKNTSPKSHAPPERKAMRISRFIKPKNPLMIATDLCLG